VWHITVLAFLLGCTNAMDAPARQTFISDMVGHDQLTNGIRLNSIMIQTARVIGPTIAGVVLTQVGAAWCFLINGVSFLFVIVALLYINVNGVVREARRGHLLRGLLEGVRFVRGHPTIAPLLVFALVASVTLVNIIPLLPSYADLVLKSPKEGYAALNVAFGAGAVAAGVLSGWLHARIGRGRVAAWGMVLSALAMAALAFTDALPVALALAATFGFLMILAFVTCNTLVQSEVPDAFRGRVMALYTLTFFGIAPLGALPVGMVANALGTPLAVLLCAVVGGVGCAAIMLRAPQARALV
jgi:MFS family permease